MKGKGELKKIPKAILPLCCTFLSTGVKTVVGGGGGFAGTCCNPPSELGLTCKLPPPPKKKMQERLTIGNNDHDKDQFFSFNQSLDTQGSDPAQHQMYKSLLPCPKLLQGYIFSKFNDCFWHELIWWCSYSFILRFCLCMVSHLPAYYLVFLYLAKIL